MFLVVSQPRRFVARNNRGNRGFGMFARNLPRICSELRRFAWNSLGKFPGPGHKKRLIGTNGPHKVSNKGCNGKRLKTKGRFVKGWFWRMYPRSISLGSTRMSPLISDSCQGIVKVVGIVKALRRDYGVVILLEQGRFCNLGRFW